MEVSSIKFLPFDRVIYDIVLLLDSYDGFLIWNRENQVRRCDFWAWGTAVLDWKHYTEIESVLGFATEMNTLSN